LDARGLIDAVSEPQETQIEPIFLNKTKWKKAPLVSVKTVSHDSRVYRFALQDKDQTLGLVSEVCFVGDQSVLIAHTSESQPTGQHVFVRLRRKAPRESTSEEDRENAEFEETRVVEGEMVQRAYTPVSSASATGHIDLLIKLYLANETWRNGGKMTTGFNELELGDEIEFKGPLGSFTYLERGLCRWRGVERKVNTFGMICAGSGITPILQVVREIVDGDARSETGQEDLPKVWCVDSNRKEEDIRECR
jgi:nitrate reductase (NAD(P)H)